MLNENAAISIGYDQNLVDKTKQNGLGRAQPGTRDAGEADTGRVMSIQGTHHPERVPRRRCHPRYTRCLTDRTRADFV